MFTILRLALKELRYTAGKLRLVIFILLIGFIGPLFSSALKTSIAAYLDQSSKKILSADISVNSMNDFSASDVSWIQKNLKPIEKSEQTEFVTMAKAQATAGAAATLVEVEGVDAKFPIYGSFRFSDASKRQASGLDDEDHGQAVAWVFPEVLAELGLKIGDSITLGKTPFKITRVIDDAPGSSRMGGFAPRIFISRKNIEATGLIQFGSQVYHRIYLKLPADQDVDDASDLISDELGNPDIFVRTPDDSVQGFERFFKFFNLYLVAIAMIVFALSWMGAFYCMQVFLQQRLRNAAVLMINGGSRMAAGILYSLQVVAVMVLAFVLATLFVFIATRLTQPLAAAQLPEGFVLNLGLEDIAHFAAIALISAVAFNAPFLLRLYSLKFQSLLSEDALGNERMSKVAALISYGPLLVIFILLSTWLMDSWADAFRLAGGMAAAALVGWVAGRALFVGLYRWRKAKPGFLRLIATQLARSRFGINLCFLALVLNALALNLVPHLLNSVVSEVEPLQGSEVPALFLFNVPESSLDQLKEFAKTHEAELRYVSPMILARLTKLNGQGTDSDSFQRFPVRLSYRNQRIPSESIIAGHDLPLTYDTQKNPMPEISVEQKFAERNGFKIGDQLEFDVQGLPITAEITSLRHVQWTTFNPNFFIMFQSGVLDDAPKTWIANVNLSGGDAQKMKIQYDLTRDFPDVSIIDIGRTIARALEIARSVITPIKISAWIAVLMSFLVLLGIVIHNLQLREREIDIEKMLGANASLIRALLTGEYAAIAFFAWLVGSATSIVLAWAVTHFLLDINLRLSFFALGLSFVIAVGCTCAIAFLSSDRILRMRGASSKL